MTVLRIASLVVSTSLLLGAAPPDRERCLAVLHEGLASGEFWPSMHAAEALSQEGEGAEVRRALASRLASETDAQRRCGIARELVRAGDLARVRTLLDVLASPDPYGHAHACESLYKVREVGDGVLLRRAMDEPVPSLRSLMAAAALARWGNPEAFALVRKTLAHPDETLARTAAWILGRVGDARDLPALRAGRDRFAESLTRAYFDHALAALGDPEGRAALVRNLDHDDPKVRVYACEFAPDARATEAVDALTRRLDDPDLDVRLRAAQALLALARPAVDGGEFAVDVFPADAGHPRYSEGSVAVLRDGRLLYATTEFDASSSDFARARILAVESADEGRTWGPRRVLQENVGKMNVMSASLFRLLPNATFDGPIGLLYLQKDSHTVLNAFLRVSEDEGATFGPPARATTAPGYHVVNNDRVTVLSSGRLVVPAASTADVAGDGGGRFEASCFLSDDRGATWRRSRTTVPYPKRGAMEPEVIEMDGGRLLMHFRTQLGHIAVCESEDGGETWGEARSWEVTAPEAPSTLRRIPSTGDLLLVWNDSVKPGAGHGGPRTPLSAAVSRDGGLTWSRPIAVEGSADATYAYTSLTFHRGRALLTYYVGPASWERLSSRFRSIPIARLYGAGE